jgi:hypothetical protein
MDLASAQPSRLAIGASHRSPLHVTNFILGDKSVFGIAYAGTRQEGTSFSGLAVLLADKIPANETDA